MTSEKSYIKETIIFNDPHFRQANDLTLKTFIEKNTKYFKMHFYIKGSWKLSTSETQNYSNYKKLQYFDTFSNVFV